MTMIGRALAATEVIPFTPATYDTAFRASLMPGLPAVTAESMYAIPGCFAATVGISEDTAKIALQIFRYGDDGTRELDRQHPVYDLLHDRPNADHTAIQWREWMTAIALNRGRAVSEIVPGRRGPVDQLKPLHPDWLTTEKVSIDGQLVTRWRYSPPDEKSRVLTRDQLFVLSGRLGMGVVTAARRNLEVQLAMQRAVAEMYGRGLRSPGYLHTSKRIDSPTARAQLREALDEYMGGGERAGRPMLLDDGMEWKTIAWTFADMEFLATLKHTLGDVARWYRYPLHKLYELVAGTHASLSVMAVDYVIDSLLSWAVRWEQSIKRDLILSPRHAAQHNLESLLRGDTKSRFEAYKIAVTFGWMTRNEVRQRENLNPLKGLDDPILPANMAAQVAGGSPGAGPVPSSAATRAHLRVLVRDGAARIVRKEQATLAKLAEKGEWSDQAVRDFYREHAEFTARVLRIPEEVALEYAEQRAAALIEGGPELLEAPESEHIADLTETALARSAVFAEDRKQLAAAVGAAA